MIGRHFYGGSVLHLVASRLLCQKAAEATIEAAQQAKQLGCIVSIDLNFKETEMDNNLSERTCTKNNASDFTLCRCCYC